MTETWKDVKGYEGAYQVSNLGNVRSLDRSTEVRKGNNTYTLVLKGKVLQPLVRNHGYLGVQLFDRLQATNARGMRTVSIHRLVAEAFVPNPDGLPEVNHKDEDKTNNRADNLEWMNHIENTRYGTAVQRRTDKEINGKKSKPICQYTLDGKLVAEYPSLNEVGRSTGLGIGNISRCANGSPQYRHAYGYLWVWA